jgi:light-regulated signal transduction histidine kinase (bacteriophytochrome)
MTGQLGRMIKGPVAGVAEAGAGDCCVPLDSRSLHDLIGPVNQMCSLADLILAKYRGSLGGDAEALFGHVRSAADRLQNLLNGLRTYTRVIGSRSPYRHCESEGLLAAALAQTGAAIDESNAVITHGRLPTLHCDPNQMTYAFASLIENAIKFRGQSRPEICISARSEDDHWIFSFRDNGIGIEPLHQDGIFGVFRRVHNDGYPGAGMGLPITRRIVEGHGGRIWVDSQPGQGSTFFLLLPKCEN